MVALSFVLESSFIALTGILIGVIAGLLLGGDMVRTLFAQLTPETVLTAPWGQLGVILLLAYGLLAAADADTVASGVEDLPRRGH